MKLITKVKKKVLSGKTMKNHEKTQLFTYLLTILVLQQVHEVVQVRL